MIDDMVDALVEETGVAPELVRTILVDGLLPAYNKGLEDAASLVESIGDGSTPKGRLMHVKYEGWPVGEALAYEIRSIKK